MGESSSVSHDLLGSWVAGWALARDLGPPVPAYGGFRVDVGLPDQAARYVFAKASQELRRASAEIHDPNVFLKICAAPDLVTPLLADGWTIKPLGFFMTASRLAGAAPSPPGYEVNVRRVTSGYAVSVHAGSDDIVASGRVVIVGTTAVFDRIETDPAHRRRGLGRTLTTRLGGLAVQDGAETGALVATPDGRALYGAMGWRLRSLYTTAVRD